MHHSRTLRIFMTWSRQDVLIRSRLVHGFFHPGEERSNSVQVEQEQNWIVRGDLEFSGEAIPDSKYLDYNSTNMLALTRHAIVEQTDQIDSTRLKRSKIPPTGGSSDGEANKQFLQLLWQSLSSHPHRTLYTYRSYAIPTSPS